MVSAVFSLQWVMALWQWVYGLWVYTMALAKSSQLVDAT